MKQIILYITFFNIVFNVFGQINPIDSVLYSNGDLKAIKYEKMDRLSGYSLIRYFKKSLNSRY